jgi:hypothetical protein
VSAIPSRMIVTAAALTVVLFALNCYALQIPESILPLLQSKVKIASELAKPVSRCVAREDTGHYSFHGCIDWHSAVHGVWALIAYSRATGDTQYQSLISDALEAAKIDAERQMIRTRPGFEMPYGCAWFLRLAIEERLYSDHPKLKEMGDEVLGSLMTHFAKVGIDPDSTDYDSDSWALINMYDYAKLYKNDSAEKTIKNWILNKFARPSAKCDLSLERGSFMAVCTNWAWLVSLVMTREEFLPWLEAFFGKSGLPKPIEHPVGWHNYGLNFSRAWGLWEIYLATGETRFADLYASHFKTAYDDPGNWRGSYEGVAHWVPQFGMFAIQPLFDKSGW